MSSIYPVILSGGSGTRLWPLSRAMYPKQFIRFVNGQSSSFLGATLRRLGTDAGCAQPILVCNNDHRFLVKDEIDRAGILPYAIILEPVARNTGAAIAVAALAVAEEDPSAILIVMPSDHVIKDEARFTEAVRRAAVVAASGHLVLFGIEPADPNTGYGYIRRGAALEGFGNSVFRIDAFVEKPDRPTAIRYLQQGQYFWNSGIFVLHAKTFLDELADFEPRVLDAARTALAKATADLGFLRLDRDAFAQAPSISVDHAVMERTRKAVMLPLDVGWSDIGSWTSLWDITPHDAAGNAVHGEALLEDTANCYVHGERSFIATIGIKDLAIVNTPDALLVADRSRTQDVSKIVAKLRQLNRKEHEQHLVNHRPWGHFETLAVGPRFQVKKLHVKPGGILSMQMHHHRSEHWVVVHGTAKVVVGDKEQWVRENDSVYIIATQWHRLENPGKVPLEIIEVQIGTYLGEDDIVRSEDIYHRAPDETK